VPERYRTNGKLALRQSNDNNLCPGCGERFRSVRAFDMHRTGSYGARGPDGGYVPAQRRCKTPDEMQADGMQRNARGLWISKGLSLPLRLHLEGAGDAWGIRR
jgi:hypothetical protein